MNDPLKAALGRITNLEEEVDSLRKLVKKLTARIDGMDGGGGGGGIFGDLGDRITRTMHFGEDDDEVS